jgi:lia operon protein LiaG
MPRFPLRSLVPIVLLALPAALRAQQTPERYTIDDDAVAIYNLVGAVRLESGEGALAVQVTRAGAEAARLRVAQGEIDGRATLRVLYPEDRIDSGKESRGSSTTLRVRDDGTFGDTDGEHEHGRHHRDGWEEGRKVTIASGGGLDARADLVIRVPRGRRVAVYLAVGSVAVTNVDGDLSLDTHEAEVTANGVKGRLGIDVGSGSVRATQIDGDLSVDTGSGSVEVSRVHGTSLSIDTGSGDVTGSDLEAGELSVDTGSGSIRLAGVAAPDLSLGTGSGSVAAELRRDVASLHVETGSGDITIRAPASLGAEVEIETSSGDIETNFPLQITQHARDHMVGTIGDGKGTIAIETGSGGVRLLKGSN